MSCDDSAWKLQFTDLSFLVYDAQAGHEGYTSEQIYGLAPGQVGRLNDRTLPLF